MGAKKQHAGMPSNPPKDRTPAVMLIRKEIPAEEFLKAYGKYNYVKSAK